MVSGTHVHRCYGDIENLVTNIVNDDGVTFEQAVETIRETLDYLYGKNIISAEGDYLCSTV